MQTRGWPTAPTLLAFAAKPGSLCSDKAKYRSAASPALKAYFLKSRLTGAFGRLAVGLLGRITPARLLFTAGCG
jgi:hypothetical protein